MDYWPTVTADGRYIVFYSTRSGAFEIWREDLSGGNPVQLTEGGNHLPRTATANPGLRWTPDGKQLALARGTQSFDVARIRRFK